MDEEIKIHWVNSDNNLPINFPIVEQFGGIWKGNPGIKLFSVDEQKTEEGIGWKDFLNIVSNLNPLNAATLYYLICHPEFIPESWKTKIVMFFGTIFYVPQGNKAVAGLEWGGSGWLGELFILKDKARLTSNVFTAIVGEIPFPIISEYPGLN